MFLRIGVVGIWIALTVAFYVAVALVCQDRRPHPLMVAAYATVRGAVSGSRRWVWYVALFAGTIVVTSAALWCGIQLSGAGLAWTVAVYAVTSLSVGYAVFVFRPRPADGTRLQSVLAAAAAFVVALACAVGYLMAHVQAPNWLVLGIGTYALCVPPLVWFRAVRIRTAVCLLSASAVYDAIHVFGTDWMDTFMAAIRATPGVLRLPEGFALDAMHFFSIGHGDVLAPGLLVVVAARTAEGPGRRWLVCCTCLGAAAGHALAVLVTIAIGRSLPALIVLVPATCLGYGVGHLAARLAMRPKSKPLPVAVAAQGAE